MLVWSLFLNQAGGASQAVGRGRARGWQECEEGKVKVSGRIDGTGKEEAVNMKWSRRMNQVR